MFDLQIKRPGRVIAVLLFLFCNHLSAQEISIPKNYQILDSISGDLSFDSIKELVVVYNTAPDTSDNGVERELIIYKKSNLGWEIWKRSMQALYHSKGGGMMGDPYAGIEIKNNTLRISHYGGSGAKWSNTDTYRFQNSEFYLIGFDDYNGRLCDAFNELSFNLSTGKIIAKQYTETCNDSLEPISNSTQQETWYYKNLRITLQERQGKQLVLVSPKNNWEFYISSGTE